MAARKLKRTALHPATVMTVKKTPVTLPKTVLNQVRDGMREASRGLGSLYFEARVVVNKQLVAGSAPHGAVARIAGKYGFRFDNDELVFSSTKLERVKEELVALHEGLKTDGFGIWRYWIGEVMMDSNNFDTLKLL